ncbi:MAG: glycosyltransferase family 2 protein [Sulfuricaulis sp.]
MSRPLISIVLTAYNRCHLLPRAINSVLDGAYENFELIIVDDASTDATSEVVSQLKDPRIQYVRLPVNGGVLRARNCGFDTARGDYVTILDDDDELLPDALSVVAEEFERTKDEHAEVLWFDCRDAESGQKSGTMPGPGGPVDFEDYVCGRIHGDFWMAFSKNALHGNRFNERLKAHESLLWLRIHRAHKARYVPKILCRKYREHGGPRLCDINVRLGQLKQTTLALTLFIQEFGDAVMRVCPTTYGSKLAYLGLHQMAIDDFASGRSSVLRSLKYRFTIKYILLYSLSFILTSKHVKAIIMRMES